MACVICIHFSELIDHILCSIGTVEHIGLYFKYMFNVSLSLDFTLL